MSPREVFLRPLVKQVAFEVRYPNLFFIEGRIGDFQVKVMKDFPKSDLVLRRNLMVVGGSPNNIEELVKQQQADSVDRIWQFTSPSGTKLQISGTSLLLSSENHRSYHHGEAESFRAVINRAVGYFFDMVGIPVVLRVGLRYINECPIFERSTRIFNECYNSILPLNRYGLEHAVNMDCAVVVNKEQSQFRHLESLKSGQGEARLILDLDAWTENVPSENVMASADTLHGIISDEFWNTVKEPILDFMRRPKGEDR